MRHPVHKFLEEFASDEPAAEPVVLQLRPRAGKPPAPAVAAAEAAATSRAEEAHSRGYEDGRAAGRAEAETELAALIADAEQRSAETRRLFAETVATDLATGLRRGLDRLHETLEAQVAAALLPVLRHFMAETAIRELAAAMRDLARDGNAATVELTGPQELVERVWHCYGDLERDAPTGVTPVVRFTEGAEAEIRVTANGTAIETRLNAWCLRLTEAVG